MLLASSYILGQLPQIVIINKAGQPVIPVRKYHKKQGIITPLRDACRCRIAALPALFALLLGAGCALHGPASAQRLLNDAGWTQFVLPAGGLPLAWFSEPLPADTPHLHVYLGGDGRAFATRRRIARDPTSSEHLGLRLALADPAPSAFLGRPCYYGGATEPPCEPALWTLERYGPRVVAAVVAALADIAARYPRARLTLVGYSGGGVIAVLAARQLDRVERVITVASPLDTAAWTRHHGYTELAAASNPADLGDWPARTRQLHLVGTDDAQVPPFIAASYHTRTGLAPPHSVTVPLDGYDHRCCWLREWPAILGSPAGREGHQPSRK